MRDRAALGPVHKNFSSIFMRRSLIEMLGGWDAVRINGDAELMRRVEHATEPDQRGEILPGVPLTFALSRSSSLTSCEKTGIRSLYYGVREEYQQAANDHLERCKPTGDYRLTRKSIKDPFPVPISWPRPIDRGQCMTSY